MVGDKLLEAGVITKEQLDTALREAMEKKERVGDAVVRLGFATREKVEAALK